MHACRACEANVSVLPMHHERSPSVSVLLGAASTLALFAAHHAYGALRYRTLWRMHGAAVAVLFALPLYAAFSIERRRRLAGWVLVALAYVGPVVAIGVFEGLYNHLTKNLLFFGGASPALLVDLFPPPTYEMPDDAWFEISGVLQIVPAFFTARAGLRWLRARGCSAPRATSGASAR